MVNQSTFADRMGLSKNAVSKLVKSGRLHAQKIQGYNGMWLDWDLARATYNKLKRTERRGGKRQQENDRKAFFQVRKVQSSSVATPSDQLPSLDIGAVASEALVGFDPEAPENADCWQYDESGNAVIVPSTGKHFIDWKMAIDKCMAKIRNQQYLEKEGSLLPKEEVTKALSEVFPILASAVMQIPDRFCSRLQGCVEDMMGHSMTNENKTVFKSILSDEAVAICHNFQDAVEKVLSE